MRDTIFVVGKWLKCPALKVKENVRNLEVEKVGWRDKKGSKERS